jgi:hypothetical protein
MFIQAGRETKGKKRTDIANDTLIYSYPVTTKGRTTTETMEFPLSDLCLAATALQQELLKYLETHLCPSGYGHLATDIPDVKLETSPGGITVWDQKQMKERVLKFASSVPAHLEKNYGGIENLVKLLDMEEDFLKILATIFLIQGPVAPRYSSLAEATFSGKDKSLVAFGKDIALMTGGSKQRWGIPQKAVHLLSPKLQKVVVHYFGIIRPALVKVYGSYNRYKGLESNHQHWENFIFCTYKGRWSNEMLVKAVDKHLAPQFGVVHFPHGALRQWATRLFATILKEFDSKTELSDDYVLKLGNPQLLAPQVIRKPVKKAYHQGDVFDEKFIGLAKCCYAWHIFLGLRDSNDFPFEGNIGSLTKYSKSS